VGFKFGHLLAAEYKLRLFQNEVYGRGIYGYKKENATGEWKKLHK
jgi:hypothetical protein